MQKSCYKWRPGRASALAGLVAATLACSRTPSQLSRFPDDLSKPEVEASGIYPDGWAAETASANLSQPNGDEVLTVRGTIPKIDNADFHSEVVLLVDGHEVGRRGVGLGDFQLSAPVKSAPGKRNVTVRFSAGQELPAGDARTVGARLAFVGFERSRAASSGSAPDIVRGGLKLGSGWGALERFHDETFRWVDNDAVLSLTAGQGPDAELELALEAGPGTDGKCLLKVLDTQNRQVGAVRVAGRQVVHVFVPVEAGKANEFKLHVDGGGKKIPTDARVLNLRVFSASAAEK